MEKDRFTHLKNQIRPYYLFTTRSIIKHGLIESPEEKITNKTNVYGKT